MDNFFFSGLDKKKYSSIQFIKNWSNPILFNKKLNLFINSLFFINEYLVYYKLFMDRYPIHLQEKYSLKMLK